MNLSTAVFLLPESAARAVMVTYEADEPYKKATRTMFKTFDKSIGVDDYVVVPTDTRHKLTVCRVVEVDADIDFDSDTQVAWLVGRVDLADTNEIKAQEEKIIGIIKAAEKQKKKNELAASMAALVTANGGDIKALSFGIAKEPATEEKPAA